MSSTFLSLPLELRELIYKELFRSCTVRHGFGRFSRSNRTAILQTCRQVSIEAWRFLPLHVMFHFRGTEAMLDTLMSVDQAIVTRVRYVHVKAFPFPLYQSGRRDYYPIYDFSNALSLLPGLHLEELVVEDAFHGHGLVETWRDVVTYFDIEAILRSDAWKKLVYITPNTDFITSGYDHKRKRLAQPENWDAQIRVRDGEESGAHVQMFITPELVSSNATSEDETMRPWFAKPGHEVAENWRLAGPEQDMKGKVTIVARRDKRASPNQKTGQSETKSWQELKDKEGGFRRADWTPYYMDVADAIGWTHSGWGRRMQLAKAALNN